MKKHFKLTSETKVTISGVTLYRIELVIDCKWGKSGDKGGFIQKEENLSGNAWVSDNAEVFGDARVYGDAEVFGNARVFDNAWVSDNARVFGNAMVFGNARVSDNAMVFGNARVFDNARVFGNARVFDNAEVSGNAISTKKVFTLNFVYKLTMTDLHIKYGCIQKTFKEWKEWLDSDNVIETERNDEKFKLIRLSLELALEQSKSI